jgi:hypothetical protein
MDLVDELGTTFATNTVVNAITSAGDPPGAGTPRVYSLAQNYPNPFNPVTTIAYSLGARSGVSLIVYNTLGQSVATLVDEMQEPGDHHVRFDGSRFASGVYFYRIVAGSFIESKKLVLLK